MEFVSSDNYNLEAIAICKLLRFGSWWDLEVNGIWTFTGLDLEVSVVSVGIMEFGS